MSAIANFFKETFLLFAGLVRPAARSVRENTGLAALSVVLAFGIWIVVTQTDNPSRSTIVNQDITVEPVNIPSGVAVVEPLPAIRVRVTAPEDVTKDLSAADFQATVNLDGYTVGQYEIQPTVTTQKRNVRIDEIIPVGQENSSGEKVRINLAELKSKIVPVTVEVGGSPAAGFTMGDATSDDTSVTVSGPKSVVDRVAKVVASINIDSRTEDVDQSVHLVARSAEGELIQGVRIDPAITGITVDISQEKFSRPVTINPRITGAPAPGYNVISISVSPPTVTVSGSRELVNSISTIDTKSIDLDDASADVIKTVSLDLPTGAEITGSTSVTVTIKIAAAQGNFVFAVPVTARNLGDDVAITGALPVVNVTIFGPLPELQTVTPNDLSATIDLSGDDPGEHREQVQVTAPGTSRVTAVNPSEITVTLVRR
jgi:YbbR domain-containing protein